MRRFRNSLIVLCFLTGFNVLIRMYRRKEDMGFVMWNRFAFFTLILTSFGTKSVPIETDFVLSQEIPIEGTIMANESRLPATTRVDPLVFQKSKCISSASIPIYSSPAVKCPCFLRYLIGSDDPTTWDVFFVPLQSYNSWKEKDYKGDPGNVVEKYSIRKQKTGGKNSFLRTPDVNVFIDGEYVIAIRTNTNEKRCFNSRNENSISSSLVFESMPKACEMPTGSTDQRIVGGTPVNVSNAPDLFKWMALIWQSNEQPVCGGAQIAPGYIVTAAHCNVHLSVSSYQIKIGTLQADKGKAFEISRAFTHPKYQQLTTKEAYSDIAILELKDPDAELSDSTIDWNWKETIPRAGEYVTAAGFGYISEGWNALPDPNRLLRVDVPVVSRPECKNRYENVDGSVHLCAGREEGNCDSCQADSGGPLRYIETLENGSRRQLLVGIVSFGSGCAQSRSPGVYTRVSTYAAWINKTLITARATKKETGFLRNTAAVAGVSTGAVVVVIVLVVVLVIFIKRRRVSGHAQVVNGDEGSDIPSTSGISQ